MIDKRPSCQFTVCSFVWCTNINCILEVIKALLNIPAFLVEVVIIFCCSTGVADKCKNTSTLVIEDVYIFHAFIVSFFHTHEVKFLHTLPAVIPVDIAGVPCNYEKIFAAVESRRELFHPENEIQKAIGRVAVVADSAHAFGAQWRDQKVGAIADFTAFSFHAVKNLTTGEGGALTWRNIAGIDNDSLYKEFQLLSLHGQDKDALERSEHNSWEYDIIYPGYKRNMTDITAAIGLAQMKRFPGMLARRKELIMHYNEALKDENVDILAHYTDEYASSGHLYMVRLLGRTSEERNEIIRNMASRGIATNVHFKPLPMMTAYQRLGFDINDYPNAYHFFENEITLPLYTKLTDEQVEYLLRNFKEIIH